MNYLAIFLLLPIIFFYRENLKLENGIWTCRTRSAKPEKLYISAAR